MRFIFWLFAIPVAAVAVAFAVSNLQPVQIGLWPLPFTVEVPLFVAVLPTLVLGFLAGGFVAWSGGHRTRRMARIDHGKVMRLEADLDEQRRRTEAAEIQLAALKAAAQSAAQSAPGAGPVSTLPAIRAMDTMSERSAA